MRDFCYTAIEAVPSKWRFTRGTGASIGNPRSETFMRNAYLTIFEYSYAYGLFTTAFEFNHHF